MSAILNSLKRLRTNSAGSLLPLLWISKTAKKQSSSISTLLLILLAVSLTVFAMTFFIDSGQGNYNNLILNKIVSADTGRSGADTGRVYLSEEELLERINEAVDKALAERDAELSRKLNGIRDVNVRRLSVIEALPAQAGEQASGGDSLRAEVQTAKASVQKTEYEHFNAAPPEADSHKKKTDSKVHYNALLGMSDRAFEKGNYQKSAENLTKALQMRETKMSVLKLVRVKLAMGKPEEVNRVLEAYPDTVDDKLIASAASYAGSVGYNAYALNLIDSYAGVFSGSSALYYSAGQIYEDLKNYPMAESAYSEAVRLSPFDSYYKYAYARILDINEKHEDALKEYLDISESASDKTILIQSRKRAEILEAYLTGIRARNDENF
ncbi:hypothetical protein ACMC5R_06000 [Deferribacteres bacterium DY0037]